MEKINEEKLEDIQNIQNIQNIEDIEIKTIKNKINKKKRNILIIVLSIIIILTSGVFIYSKNKNSPALLQIIDKNATKSLEKITDNYLSYKDENAEKELMENISYKSSPNYIFGPKDYIYGESTTIETVESSGLKVTDEIKQRISEYNKSSDYYARKLQEKMKSETKITENSNEIKDGKLYKNVTVTMFQENKFRYILYNLEYLIFDMIPEVKAANIKSVDDIDDSFYYYSYASRAKAFEILYTHIDDFKTDETETFDLIFEPKDGKWVLTNSMLLTDASSGLNTSENNDPAILTEGQKAIDRKIEARIALSKKYLNEALESGLMDKNDVLKLTQKIN